MMGKLVTPPIRLIATDLDGTLIGDEESPELLPVFRQLLQHAQENWQTQWAIVTGRHSIAMRGMLHHLMCAGLRPNYVIAEDARIYRHVGQGQLLPLFWWNLTVRWRRCRMVSRWRKQVQAWHDEILDRFPAAVDLSPREVHFWVSLKTVENAIEAEALLRDKVAGLGEFFVFRWDKEICLMPTAGSKGEAVEKLAEHLKIDLADVFAIGDGPNDVSMLDGSAAGHVACVGNATAEVANIVRIVGGHVAEGECLDGVIEALRKYIHLPDEGKSA